jgi:oligoendopeptidase F
MRPFDTPLPRDTAEAGSGALGELPVWDLTDLYAAPDAPEIAADLDRVEAAARDFAGRYQDRLAELDAAGWLTCIQAYEDIDRVAGRLISYAGLRYHQDTSDPERGKLLGDLQDRITAATTPLVFFSLSSGCGR